MAASATPPDIERRDVPVAAAEPERGVEIFADGTDVPDTRLARVRPLADRLSDSECRFARVPHHPNAGSGGGDGARSEGPRHREAIDRGADAVDEHVLRVIVPVEPREGAVARSGSSALAPADLPMRARRTLGREALLADQIHGPDVGHVARAKPMDTKRVLGRNGR